MFFIQWLMWLAEGGWLMLLHLSARRSFPPVLSSAEETELVRRMGEGDGAAADRLIEHNLRLVAHIAKKYARSAADQEELISIGSLGLIKAVRTFRPEAGRLSAYASRCIENEMRMHFRAGRRAAEMVLVGDSLGRDEDGSEVLLSELLGTEPDIVPREAETSIEAGRAMRLLDSALLPREAEVIRLRYGLKDGRARPQHEVAARLDISRSYVSRIEKRALEKLRLALEPPMVRS